MTRNTALTVRGPTARIAPVSSTCASGQARLENRSDNPTMAFVSPDGIVAMIDLPARIGQLVTIPRAYAFSIHPHKWTKSSLARDIRWATCAACRVPACSGAADAIARPARRRLPLRVRTARMDCSARNLPRALGTLRPHRRRRSAAGRCPVPVAETDGLVVCVSWRRSAYSCSWSTCAAGGACADQRGDRAGRGDVARRAPRAPAQGAPG